MILTKEMIGKDMRKKRNSAVQLLNRLAKAGGLPEPLYEHRAGGSAKYRSHYYKVHFRVPDFIRSDPDYDHFKTSIVASGRDKQKGYARSLAALEAVLFSKKASTCAEGACWRKSTSMKSNKKKRKRNSISTSRK